MAEQRMSTRLTKLAQKRGRLPALVTALALGGLLAVQQFVTGVVAFLTYLVYAASAPAETGGGLEQLTTAGFQFQPTLDQLLFLILPFALGVFIALWLIAPISDELTLPFVLTRAGLAAASAAVVVIVFTAVKGLFDSIGALSPFDAAESAPAGVNLAAFGYNALNAVTGGINIFVFSGPAVLLAGVMLWLWLRAHPREYAVAGLVDEL